MKRPADPEAWRQSLKDPKVVDEEADEKSLLRAMRKGALAATLAVGLVVGLAFLMGVLPLDAKAAADTSCRDAVVRHLQQAETASSAEERQSHADLARAYQVEDALGHSCAEET